MSNVRDIGAGMALSALALGGIIPGMTIGFTLVPILVGFKVCGIISLPAALTTFAVFLLFVMAVIGRGGARAFASRTCNARPATGAAEQGSERVCL